ncbi:MAG: neutral zinc metallopeptidase [Actinomycetes bacterium]
MTSPWGRPSWGPPGSAPSPYGGGWQRAPYGSPFGSPRLPQYPPGPAMPPPRRRRNPLASLLRALVFLTLVSVVGMVLINSMAGTQAPAAPYQNEDYRVPPPDLSPPPLPVPETVGEAEAYIAENRFYEQTAPVPVRCSAPPINVRTADDDQLQAHFEGLMECLVRVWEQPVAAAGWEMVRPTVTIYGSRVTTKCGTTEVNAFYCAADQQIYYSNRLSDAVTIVRRNKWAADVVMAHEFGHALQARTAILISAKALGQQSGSQQTELELSRRLETQADCFSGMFMRAVADSVGIAPSDREGIEDTYTAVGDDVLSGQANINGNHGLGRSRRYWGAAGLDTSRVGDCNTFVVERSLVR